MQKKSYGIIGTALFGAAVLCGAGLAWLIKTFEVNVPLERQQLKVSVPQPFAAQVQLTEPLPVQVDSRVAVQVPLRQTVAIPIDQTIHAMVHLEDDVPLKTQIRVKHTIPIAQTIHIDSKVKVEILGHSFDLPVRGDVPIRADIPLDINVPIAQSVPVQLHAAAQVPLRQTLQIPLDTRIDTEAHINGQLKVALPDSLATQVTLKQPLDIQIAQTQIRFPLHAIGFKPHS